MKATAAGGANEDLSDAIGFAVRRLGGSTAGIGAASASEVDGISASDYDALIDLSELRLLETILMRLNDSSYDGPRAAQMEQRAQRVSEIIDRKKASILRYYNILASPPQSGVIGLDFVEPVDEDSDED
jgi:hypothetical protein